MASDLDEHEKEIALRAGATAAEYLEEIGVTDLAKMTKEQWETFCGCFYREAMIPF